MSDRIGDYVHFHTINYINWGINHVGVSGSTAADASSFVQTQKDKIDRSITTFGNTMTSSERQELATQLTWLMRPPSDSKLYPQNQSIEAYNELWTVLLSFFQEEFGDAVDRIERSTANIFAGVQIADFKKITIEKGQSQVQAKTIQTRLDAIANALKNPNGMYSQAELNTINKLYQDIVAEKNKLTGETAAKLSQLGISGQNSLLDLNETQDLIRAINKATAISSGITNLQKGTLFEYMIAVAPLIGKNLTGKALRDAVEEALAGVVGTTGKSSVTFDPQMFDTEADLASILKGTYSYNVNDNLFVANHMTQDKVDVQLQLSTKKTVNVSAKNINLSGANSRGVHIVSGMSLLSGFASINNASLVTHYLNQHAFGRGGLSYYAQGNLGSIYDSTSDILKISLIQQALEGYKQGSAKADVFIINDNTSGTIKIYNMSDLLEHIMKVGFVEQLVNMQPDISAIHLNNTFHAGSYAGRITDILSQIHSYKVTIALMPGIFY